MPKLNPYLNFDGKAEEAIMFYHSVLGGNLLGEIYRFGGAPGTENLSEDERNRVMHAALKVGDNLIMVSDIMPSMGHKVAAGNNHYISIFPDSREQADQFYKGLSEGGTIEVPLEDQFWGDYFGSFTDRYGIGWMINYTGKN